MKDANLNAAEHTDIAPRHDSPEKNINSSNEPSAKPEYIVAIGGSAGGLEAFEHFFSGIPPDTGMSFIVIQHLDPTHESLLTELIQRATEMHVKEAQDGIRVEPNTVYVIPHNTDLSIHHGLLNLC